MWCKQMGTQNLVTSPTDDWFESSHFQGWLFLQSTNTFSKDGDGGKEGLYMLCDSSWCIAQQTGQMDSQHYFQQF